MTEENSEEGLRGVTYASEGECCAWTWSLNATCGVTSSRRACLFLPPCPQLQDTGGPIDGGHGGEGDSPNLARLVAFNSAVADILPRASTGSGGLRSGPHHDGLGLPRVGRPLDIQLSAICNTLQMSIDACQGLFDVSGPLILRALPTPFPHIRTHCRLGPVGYCCSCQLGRCCLDAYCSAFHRTRR